MNDGKIYFNTLTPGKLKLDCRVFENVEEFCTEWAKEAPKWNELRSRNSDNAPIWNIFATFRDHIKNGIDSKDPEKINALIVDYYETRVGQDEIFYPSWSPLGRFLTKPYSDNSEFEGCLGAIYPSLASKRNSSDSYTKRIAAYVNAYLLKSGVPLPQLKDFYDEAGKFALEHERIVTDTRKRMNEMQEFYDTRIKLQASESYWGKKARLHMWTRYVAFVLTFIFASVGALGLFCYLRHGHSIMTEEMHGWPWSFACGFLILVSLVFWAVRFFARIYNQQEALYNDAKERVVMTETFLALTSNEVTKSVVTKEEHIGIILAALFRPASCSFSNDGPDAPIETVANAVKKTTS